MTRFPRTDVVFPGSLVANGVDKPSCSTGGRGSEGRDGGSSLERAFRKARGLRCRRRRGGDGAIDGVGRESSGMAKHGPRRLFIICRGLGAQNLHDARVKVVKGQGFFSIVIKKGAQGGELCVELVEVRFGPEAMRRGPKHGTKMLDIMLGPRVTSEEPFLQFVIVTPISATRGVVAIGYEGPSLTGGFLENLWIQGQES